MNLATARTRILPYGESLLDALRDYYLRNRRHLDPWEPQRPLDFHSRRAWWARYRAAHDDIMAGRSTKWVALAPDTERVLAVCNFTNISRGPFQACTLGYSVDAAAQGAGIMYEVADRTIRYMFEEEGLHRIMANYMPENTRSGALLKRLGFEREGYARSYLKINGVWRDHILTSRINPAQD